MKNMNLRHYSVYFELKNFHTTHKFCINILQAVLAVLGIFSMSAKI